jgi:hypothetical protein
MRISPYLFSLLVTVPAVTNAFSVAGSARWMRRQHTSAARTASSSLSANGLVEAWDAYNAALSTDPLIVKSVTAGLILGTADLAGQAFEKSKRWSAASDADSNSSNKVEQEEEQQVDLARAARFAIFGLVLQAPWNHFYYQLLDGQIPPTEEPFSNTNIIKVVIDQFIVSTHLSTSKT